MLTQSSNDVPGVLTTNGTGKVPTLPDGGWRGLGATFRWIVIAVLTVAVLLPLSFIVLQSFLNAPFFDANRTFGIAGYRFIFEDPDFWSALKNSFIIAGGNAVHLDTARRHSRLPDGAHRLARTPLARAAAAHARVRLADGAGIRLRGRGRPGRFLFGVGQAIDRPRAPWIVYSITAIAIIAGLTHVPHVYLYSSSALKSLGSDVEEAARMAGRAVPVARTSACR